MKPKVDPAVSSRMVRGKRVWLATDGREFVETPVRYPSGRVGSRRRYGATGECPECHRAFFRMDRKGLFCSHSCEKRGERNPARRTMRANGRVAKATADKWFSRVVRARGACHHCGEREPGRLQCAHIFSRRYLSTRWDEDNALCLCASCHLFYTHRPIEWEDYVVGLMGADAYLELRGRAIAVAKPDYVALLDRLMARMQDLGMEAA